MADLIVTFARGRDTLTGVRRDPVPRGRFMRTELIAIGEASTVGELSAGARDEFVMVRAGAACWVAIDADPEAVALAPPNSPPDSPPAPTSTTSFYLAENGEQDFAIEPGEKVAVIAAAVEEEA
jgi:hypothetical protein